MAASMDPAEGRPVPAVETNGIEIISAQKKALGLPSLQERLPVASRKTCSALDAQAWRKTHQGLCAPYRWWRGDDVRRVS